MDYAYALAGSRETGKLTDKDVAAALRTLGGEDLSENAFFTKEKIEYLFFIGNVYFIS